MPENPKIETPEQKGRAALISRLRLRADQAEHRGRSGAAIDLRQAANEIEDLSKTPQTQSDAFRSAWAKMNIALSATYEMSSDPFKAPEQTVELIPDLMEALWNFQIEWVAMRRG